MLSLKTNNGSYRSGGKKMADWVIIVDDDETNIKMAGRILSKAGMRVTAMKSGESLIKYVEEKEIPDTK